MKENISATQNDRELNMKRKERIMTTMEWDDVKFPGFKFDRHHFIPGEYVSITEHSGEP